MTSNDFSASKITIPKIIKFELRKSYDFNSK